MRLIMLIVTLVALLMVIWSCSMPDEPELPQWDIQLVRFPIMGPDTIVIGEEITDENLIPVGADSLYHIRFNGSEQIDVSDQLKQESVSPAPFTGAIGTFEVSGALGEGVDFGIFDAFPGLAPFVGSSEPVPAADFTVPPGEFTLSNFESVTLETGTIDITIENNLGFPLGSPIRIALYDITNTDTIGAVIFSDVIADDATASESLDVAGKTISNDIRVIVSGYENGTSGTPVMIEAAAGFRVDADMSNLTANAATANIPNQEFSITESVDVSTDSIRIVSAEITSGSINLNFESEFPFDVQLNFELTDILDAFSIPLRDSVIIPANSSEQSVISLANTTMDLGNGNLDFNITGSTQSNNQLYTVNAADEITATVTVTELRFSSITADINIGTDFPSFEEEVVDLDFDIPDINFPDITFTLVFTNTPADIYINLRFEGYKEDEDPIIADYSFSLNGAQSTNTVVLSNTGITVNGVSSGSGSGLVDVINMLPERIVFSGSAQIDDDNATLTTDPIGIDYTVDVGFVYSLSAALFEGDTIDIDFDEDNPEDDEDIREVIRDYFQGASIEFTLANGVPIGGELTLRASNDSINTLFPEPETWPILSSFDFNPPPTDPVTGNVTDVPDQVISFGLTEDQVLLLSKARYAYWFISLDPITKGSLHSTDKIILRKTFLSGSLTINSDLFDKFDEEEDISNGAQKKFK